MHIGISWNESQQRYYVAVGDDDSRSFRRKEDIMPFCLTILKNTPYEKIERSLAVSLWEKPDIEKIINNIDEEWKKQEAK